MTVIVYLIGRSGTGKYTIAKQFEKQGFKIADNHLVNNPVFALLDLENTPSIPDFAWEAIGHIRTHVFDFIIQEPRHNYVLTNELLDDEGDHKLFRQFEEMARTRGSVFIPVRLTISKEENARRIQIPERALQYKSTRIDDTAYQKPLIQLDHPHLMDIDVTHLAAEAVAQQIMKGIGEYY